MSGYVIAQLSRLAAKATMERYNEGRGTNEGGIYYVPKNTTITINVLMKHLSAEVPIGVFPLAPGASRTSIGVIDLDDKPGQNWTKVAEAATEIVKAMTTYGFKPMVFRSGGGKGAHVWLAFDRPQPARAIRRFLQQILTDCGLRVGNGGVVEGHAEIFPRQDVVPLGSSGSAISLPLSRLSVMLGDQMKQVEADEGVNWHMSNPDLNFDIGDDDGGDTVPALGPLKAAVDGDALKRIVADALTNIPADEYDVWFRVGMGLKAHWDEEGYPIWKLWSSTSGKVPPDAELRRKWNTLNAVNMTLRSVLWLAKQHGWVAPTDLFQPTWKSDLLDNDKGKMIAGSTRNAALFLEHDPAFRGAFRLSDFDKCIWVMKSLPGEPAMLRVPRKLSDADVAHVKMMLEERSIYLAEHTVHGVLPVVARRHPFHQVRDWLNSLEHDGVKRLDAWLLRYLGVVDTPYYRMIGAKILLSCVARVMSPGCKVDTMAVFEGVQGRGKSTMLSILCGSEWFTDRLSDFGSKDLLMELQGRWIIEVAELATMRKADQNHVKSFLTSRNDKYRPSHARLVVEHPRQCVLMGTTNPSADRKYLTDDTGNRRYWPVAVKQINIELISADRDQLWAEAVARFKEGGEAGRWWLNDDEQRLLAAPEQKARQEGNPYTELVRKMVTHERQIQYGEVRYVGRGDGKEAKVVRLDDVMDWLGINVENRLRNHKAVGIALRDAGFVKDNNAGWRNKGRDVSDKGEWGWWYRLKDGVTSGDQDGEVSGDQDEVASAGEDVAETDTQPATKAPPTKGSIPDLDDEIPF